jgi:hypothetical protein
MRSYRSSIAAPDVINQLRRRLTTLWQHVLFEYFGAAETKYPPISESNVLIMLPMMIAPECTDMI